MNIGRQTGSVLVTEDLVATVSADSIELSLTLFTFSSKANFLAMEMALFLGRKQGN